MMGHMLQFLSAVSHLIICPKDITVYLPALSCTKYQPVSQPLYQFHGVYVDIFKVLVSCLGGGRQFLDRQTKHAGGHDEEGMHALLDQVCIQVCVCVLGRKKETRREREDDSKGSRNEMTDFS